MIELLKSAGPFAFLNIAVGAAGFLLAVAALATGKSNTGKVLGVLALVLTIVALGLGFGGYFIGMTGTHRALGNVPDDMRDLILRKGTEESRGNFVIALAAALLPLLAGLISAVRNGFRPGMVLGALTVIMAAAMGVQLASPLPPEGPPYVEPPAITLVQSNSPRELRAAGLVAITPDGLWANGARVKSLPEALAEPLVKERNATTLPVMVDAKVKFPALADLMEAADKAGRSSLQLVVLSPSGEHRLIEVFGRSEAPPRQTEKPELDLLLLVGEKTFQIGTTSGQTLDPILRENEKALSDKLAEVKATFPDLDTIRLSAEPEITFSELVKALDVTVMRDQKLLLPHVILGRFEFAKNEAGPQIGDLGTSGGAGYGTTDAAPSSGK